MATFRVGRGYSLRPLHTQTAPEIPNVRRRKKLSPENRILKFTSLYDFVSPRLGRRPVIKTSQVRNSAWAHLMGLATNEEQLTQVVELFPKWKDSRREFGPETAEAFVRRCEELMCPRLALRVFGDHSKYALPLSLPAARHLLHSLHAKHPVQYAVAASALYRVYNLPPVSTDLVSCSLLASACFKAAMEGMGSVPSVKNDKVAESAIVQHSTKTDKTVQKSAETVGIALVPALETMLNSTQPIRAGMKAKAAQVTGECPDRNEARGQVWVKWTLAKIERALEVRGEDIGWLRTWRRRSGHITDRTQAMSAS